MGAIYKNGVEYAGSGVVTSVDGKTGAVTVIPTGGTTGQVLAKASATDRDVEWITPASGGGETWRTIADITTTEEVLSLVINKDSDNNSFALSKFKAFAHIPSCTQASNGEWGVNNTWTGSAGSLNTGSARHGSFLASLNPNNTATISVEEFGMGNWNNSRITTNWSSWYNGNIITQYTFSGGFISIGIRQTNTSYNLPIGTRIIVYGVDL